MTSLLRSDAENVERALIFLDGVTDEFGSGTTPRLPRSYGSGRLGEATTAWTILAALGHNPLA